MARNYEVEVTVYPWNHQREGQITDALCEWGLHIQGEAESFGDNGEPAWAFWGEIQICGDYSEDDRHQQLQHVLSGYALTTRWRYIDDQQWDEVISTDARFTAPPPCTKAVS